MWQDALAELRARCQHPARSHRLCRRTKYATRHQASLLAKSGCRFRSLGDVYLARWYQLQVDQLYRTILVTPNEAAQLDLLERVLVEANMQI